MNRLHLTAWMLLIGGWSFNASAFWLSEGPGWADPASQALQTVRFDALGLYEPSHAVELPDGRLLFTSWSLSTNELYLGIVEGSNGLQVVWSWSVPMMELAGDEEAPEPGTAPEVLALAGLCCESDQEAVSALVKYKPGSCRASGESPGTELLVIPLVSNAVDYGVIVQLDYHPGYMPQYAFTAEGGAETAEPIFGEPALYDMVSVETNVAQNVLSGHDPARVDALLGLFAGDADEDGDEDVVVTRRSRVSRLADVIPLPASSDLESDVFWQQEDVWLVLLYNATEARFEAPQALTPGSLNLTSWPSPFFEDQDVFTMLSVDNRPGTRTVAVDWMLMDGHGLASVQVLQDGQAVCTTNALPEQSQQWVSDPLPLGTNLAFQLVAVASNAVTYPSWTSEVSVPEVVVSLQASVTGNVARLDWQLDPATTAVDGARIMLNGRMAVDWYDLDPTNRAWTTDRFLPGETNVSFFLQVLAPRGQIYDANAVEIVLEDEE